MAGLIAFALLVFFHFTQVFGASEPASDNINMHDLLPGLDDEITYRWRGQQSKVAGEALPSIIAAVVGILGKTPNEFTDKSPVQMRIAPDGVLTINKSNGRSYLVLVYAQISMAVLVVDEKFASCKLTPEELDKLQEVLVGNH